MHKLNKIQKISEKVFNDIERVRIKSQIAQIDLKIDLSPLYHLNSLIEIYI